MKIALAQINPTVGDFEGNRARIAQFAAEAEKAGAKLAVFPELSLCGYPPRDLVEKPSFVERNRSELEALARQVPGIGIVVGFASRLNGDSGRKVANSAALLAGGEVRFLQSKMLLPTYDVFDEARNFEPARKQSVVEFGGERLAITICEDMWNDKAFWKSRPDGRLYQHDPVEELFAQGATLLINISASPFSMGKPKFREQMLHAFAARYRRPVVFVNQVGGNDSLVFDGSSAALDGGGRVLARARAFAEDLLCFESSAANTEAPSNQLLEDDEAVYEALVLGTRDYVRKCGFKSVLVGLSGGVDSALTAAIAAAALGRENVLGVAMPSRYSSAGSIADARALAKNLGIRFEVLPIQPIFESYLSALNDLFAGTAPGVAEENIQARVRGNLLMSLSNKFNSLVLSTGNKSELSVGYCTLYGDMAGGLAVISDVPKTQVYRICELINDRARRRGAKTLIPQSTLDKEPSAELRPNQRDTDSLPPYDVLDVILKGYIEESETARQISERAGIDLALVERVVRMVDTNEYKRQQAAPGLKVSSKAFGIGRRYPIAQRYRE